MVFHQQILRRTTRDADDGVSRTDRVDVDNRTIASPMDFVVNIVYVMFTVLEGLLLIRFLLSLGGANRSNQFASFIYNLTRPFVAPFRGLFNVNTAVGGASRFEYEVLIGMLVYGLIAAVIIMILRSASGPIEE